MEHDWTEYSLGSVRNLNGDVFMEPGWACLRCGLRVVFPPMFSGSKTSYDRTDHIVADPELGTDLLRVRTLAVTYGAPDCESQTVRYVMLS
jgi:hypothetical protein